MRLSIVIPAFNEAQYLTSTVASIREALAANAARLAAYEVIVCDNNSTDATADIARSAGATVVFEPHNQISRARNAGAKAATGDWLLFVDADTTVFPETIAEMLDCIESERFVGGGCAVVLDQASRSARLVAWLIVRLFRFLRLAGGSFVFCRAQAWCDVGGFSEEMYAAEEVAFSKALKRWGKPRGLTFAFLTRRPVVTSARKMRTHGLGSFLRLGVRGLFLPRSTLGSRKHLDFFYDGKR